MPDIILHHYPISPFSQKVRAMFGYTGMTWQSVITSEMPPRPLLQPLAGDYRRIPVAQIGADIFCDTRTIATQIAALSGKPELAVENCEDEDLKNLLLRAELELFFACASVGAGLNMAVLLLKTFSISNVGKFFKDRLEMGRKSAVRVPMMKQARGMVMEHLHDLEMRLDDDFLFGDHPNAADFGVYHGLWLVHTLGGKKFVRKFPKTVAWLERINDFGQGIKIDITAEHALDIARNHQPKPISDQYQEDVLIGNCVAIVPTDYGQISTTGKLVGSTPRQWIIEKNDSDLGAVNIHFPKHGYALTCE